jgi:hypothetical protein
MERVSPPRALVRKAHPLPPDSTSDPQGLGALRAYLEQFWTRNLAGFKVAAEQRDEEVS